MYQHQTSKFTVTLTRPQRPTKAHNPPPQPPVSPTEPSLRYTTRHKQTDRQVLYLTLDATFHFSHSFLPPLSLSLSLTSPFITSLSLPLYHPPFFSVGLSLSPLTISTINSSCSLLRARSFFCLAACVSIPLALCVPSPSYSCSECLFVISHFN